MSSFIVVDLDESEVDIEILELIINSFVMLKKTLRKVVFVGLSARMKRYINKRNKDTSFTMTCIDDFEKAKEWLV